MKMPFVSSDPVMPCPPIQVAEPQIPNDCIWRQLTSSQLRSLTLDPQNTNLYQGFDSAETSERYCHSTLNL